MAAAHILKQASCGNGNFTLDVYPSSQPVYLDLVRKGAVASLLEAGASSRRLSAVPASVPVTRRPTTPSASAIRRVTSRTAKLEAGQWPVRFGSPHGCPFHRCDSSQRRRPDVGRSYMDDYVETPYDYDDQLRYPRLSGFGQADEGASLVYGPNIKDWPDMEPLADSVLLKVCSKIMDPSRRQTNSSRLAKRRRTAPIPWAWLNSPCPAAIRNT